MVPNFLCFMCWELGGDVVRLSYLSWSRWGSCLLGMSASLGKERSFSVQSSSSSQVSFLQKPALVSGVGFLHLRILALSELCLEQMVLTKPHPAFTWCLRWGMLRIKHWNATTWKLFFKEKKTKEKPHYSLQLPHERKQRAGTE